RRPTRHPAREAAWGALMVGAAVGTATAAGFCAERALRRLPRAVRLPALALALQPAFALRGLVEAAESVRDALDLDIDQARERLLALVSRDRQLDEPHVVSAAVESLAENLTDSVTAPLLAYAVGGLPAAYAYRAVNTLDAMIGYRGDYEYVGKLAAGLDDLANFIPARLTGLLLRAVGAVTTPRSAAPPKTNGAETAGASDVGEVSDTSGATGISGAEPAVAAGTGPNKMRTIAPMAALLGVQLEKPGTYRVGRPTRRLEPGVITEAVRIAWQVGAAVVVVGSCVALVAGRYNGRGAAA
ncbi:MAG: cobalamin biosynthesis protein, partial [Actinobacteria bacterium]|nr:cobalamin biosynthesis protein [Actinomycetota bacterium]